MLASWPPAPCPPLPPPGLTLVFVGPAGQVIGCVTGQKVCVRVDVMVTTSAGAFAVAKPTVAAVRRIGKERIFNEWTQANMLAIKE